MSAVLVFLGGGIGAVLRLLVTRGVSLWLGPDVPWGTLFVNVAGSLAMGAFAGLFVTLETGQGARLFLTTGLLGGFTTFSAFSLDAIVLYQRGETVTAAAYVLASVSLSLAALTLGLLLTRAA